MTHLSESDREWITWRQQYPHALLISDKDPLDTLVVKYPYASITDKYNPFYSPLYYFEIGSKHVFEAEEFYKIEFYKADSLLIDGFFGICATLKKPSPCFSLTFGKWRTVGDRNEEDLLKRLYVPLKLNSFEVNGRVLDDCIIAGKEELETYHPNEDVSDQPNLFVISKKYGLVYLRYDNGLSYSIDFSTFDSDNP